MNVKEIIEKYLKDNGFDGLFNADGGCACDLLTDLMPCDSEGCENCQPGYKTKCTCGDEHEFDISSEKEEKKND